MTFTNQDEWFYLLLAFNFVFLMVYGASCFHVLGIKGLILGICFVLAALGITRIILIYKQSKKGGSNEKNTNN